MLYMRNDVHVWGNTMYIMAHVQRGPLHTENIDCDQVDGDRPMRGVVALLSSDGLAHQNKKRTSSPSLNPGLTS